MVLPPLPVRRLSHHPIHLCPEICINVSFHIISSLPAKPPYALFQTPLCSLPSDFCRPISHLPWPQGIFSIRKGQGTWICLASISLWVLQLCIYSILRYTCALKSLCLKAEFGPLSDCPLCEWSLCVSNKRQLTTTTTKSGFRLQSDLCLELPKAHGHSPLIWAGFWLSSIDIKNSDLHFRACLWNETVKFLSFMIANKIFKM